MNSWKSLLAGALTAALLAPSLAMPAARGQDALPPITIRPLGTYSTGQLDAAAAEIVAYHAGTQRAYVVNGGDKTLDILDVSDPTAPALFGQVDMTPFGDAATSVAIFERPARRRRARRREDRPWRRRLSRPGRRSAGAGTTVGALPDMLTFTPDGRYVVTANEGEPNADYTVDPEGSVSIIDVSGGVAALSEASVRTAGFCRLQRRRTRPADSHLRAERHRCPGPGAGIRRHCAGQHNGFRDLAREQRSGRGRSRQCRGDGAAAAWLQALRRAGRHADNLP
jgi:hypothetical protein